MNLTPLSLMKEVSFSLLMVALKPALALPISEADTSHSLPASTWLNTPQLLVIDSTQYAFPIYFCGEKFPVHEPVVSRRWWQTLRMYGVRQKYLLGIRQRASTVFPLIEPILRQYKIPRDFRYMPIAESDLIREAVSAKGAVGYWQLMPSTARQLGLHVTDEQDDRHHLLKATVAVCRHLRYLHQELRSWTLVAAAYNSGMGYVQREMEQQGHSNYYRLRLHTETSHYLFRILAYKELLSHPRQYTTVIYSSTQVPRLRPVPRWHQPRVISRELRDASSVYSATGKYASVRWGPRPNRALNKPHSTSKQGIALTNPAPVVAEASNANVALPGPGFPIQNRRMGLATLRFRRPRLEEQQGAGDDWLHYWDW